MKKMLTSKTILTLALSLFVNSVFCSRAEAVIYAIDFTLNDGVNTGTAIGTLETVPEINVDGFGDYASGDFSFGNYEIELNVEENTFTLNNSNSTLFIRDLEVGDLTASSTDLFIDLSDPVDSNGDIFEITRNAGDGGAIGEDFALAFSSFLSSGNPSYQSVLAVETSYVIDSEVISYSLGTPEISASVPFEFSPSVGLLMVLGFCGFSFFSRRGKFISNK